MPEAPRRRGRRLALIAGAVLLLLILGVGGASLLTARPALNTAAVVRGDIRSTVETNGAPGGADLRAVAFKTARAWCACWSTRAILSPPGRSWPSRTPPRWTANCGRPIQM